MQFWIIDARPNEATDWREVLVERSQELAEAIRDVAVGGNFSLIRIRETGKDLRPDEEAELLEKSDHVQDDAWNAIRHQALAKIRSEHY